MDCLVGNITDYHPRAILTVHNSFIIMKNLNLNQRKRISKVFNCNRFLNKKVK